MASRTVTRGDPQVDQDLIDLSGDVTIVTKVLSKALKSKWRNIDLDSVPSISEQLALTEAEVATCRSILEKVKRIRPTQSTALPGGKRKKSRKS